MNFYNENDPFAAAWLRELIKAGEIPDGVVDERDIQQLIGVDLGSYTQVHLFAGIGGWPHALRLAGWPDDRPVWTGSCPCQPFSVAGKGKGTKDARHLWPWMRHLIFRWRPSIAFGEQVASADGRQWLAGVRANLETLAYVVGAADLCAAGVASPHIRQRLFWMADAGSSSSRRDAFPRGVATSNRAEGEGQAAGKSSGHREPGPVGIPDAGRAGVRGEGFGSTSETPRGVQRADGQRQRIRPDARTGNAAMASRIRDAIGSGLEGHAGNEHDRREPGRLAPQSDGSTATTVRDGHWSRFDILAFRDGKSRRVEPGTFPLAHGVPARMGRLRGYGNAIVPEVAAAFIEAYCESSESELTIGGVA